MARMRSSFAALGLAIAGGTLAWATAGSAATTQTVSFTNPAPVVFNSTGAEQQYVVPAGITSLRVTAIGAPGGGGAGGGKAHKVTGELTVTPGQTLYLEVAGAP